MKRLIVGPFNRVEGDLEVTLDVADGVVRAAYVNSPMYRGFEQILQGKAPADALVFVPRICGICSVAQSAAAAQALAGAMGLTPPRNGRLAANLLLAAENLADHFTHFYLFFMPDFARAAYQQRSWFADVESRFRAVAGTAAGSALPARAAFMRLIGILAGKWPHTLALQPGGSSRPLQASEKIRLYRQLREFRRFLEGELFGDELEAIAAIASVAALQDWVAARGPAASDFRRFLEIASDLDLARLGRGGETFISYGNYPEEQGRLFPAGVWDGSLKTFNSADIREDVSHAWYAQAEVPQHPAQGATVPLMDKAGAYSWCKAPRWQGRVVETGALARQVVAGQPLVRTLLAAGGANVMSRVVARLIEIARVLPAMEAWTQQLEPGEPYCVVGEMPREAEGEGLVEAARGALGHWLSVRRGRIHSYQIVAPTTWNFSPRDADGTPGALEQALVGAAVRDGEDAPLAVQHIVRSFDPCMVCTVH